MSDMSRCGAQLSGVPMEHIGLTSSYDACWSDVFEEHSYLKCLASEHSDLMCRYIHSGLICLSTEHSG